MKFHKLALVPLFIVSLLIVSLAHAEIYNCDGKWTNKPCEGTATKVLKEKPLSADALNKPDLDQKIAQLAKFKRFNIEGEEKHGVFVDYPPIEEFCLKEETTLVDCAEKLDKAERALSNKIAERERAKKSNP